MRTNETLKDTGKESPARTVCFASCRKLNTQLTDVKQAVLDEFEDRFTGNSHMVEAAVNEAEAIAWQTPYPHLFFPLLAQEKATAATRWAARQQMIRETRAVRAFAA
jgi:hypothetical protein